MRAPLKALGLLSCLALTSCTMQHEKPNFVYMPDMADGPGVKAQEVGAQRLPVPGTIPYGTVLADRSDALPEDPELAGRTLKNPLPRSAESMQRGRQIFMRTCYACHGATGEGDGPVVPKYPRPPSLQSEKAVGLPDGRIYHIITKGQNLMPRYATQILPQDRWAVVHYIRALQRSKHPTAQDLKRAESWVSPN